MSTVMSGCRIQTIHFQLSPFLSQKTRSHHSSSLLFSTRNPVSPSSSLTLHYHHRTPLRSLSRRGRLPLFVASPLTQDSELDWPEEETDDAGLRGSDWGQQDEVSDVEDEGRGVGGGGGGISVPPEGAKLFVGNLPFDIGSEELARVFDQAGQVEIAEVIYNRETDRSRGFGFVTMSTVEEAEKAMDMLNGYDLNGRLLTVNTASRRGSQPIRTGRSFGSNRRIYVGNLSWQVDDAGLKQVFESHGKVLEARVVYERESGRSRGFGFVKMSTDEEIDDAIEALNGKILEGRPIRVSVAEERAQRSSY